MKTLKTMKTRIIALLIAAIMVLGFMPKETKADSTHPEPPVTVYLSISDGNSFVTTSNGVLALIPISVPYFDIGYYYGLDSFYYNATADGYYEPASYNTPSSNLTPGDAQSSEDIVTVLHVLIYAMEHFYLGKDLEDCGQGALKDYMTLVDEYVPSRSFSYNTEIDNPAELIKISGTPGSLYFDKYWNFSYPSDNLNYFVDYKYPIASTGTQNGTGYGWGATADQIAVEDGMIITLAHFPAYGQYMDQEGLFAHAVLSNELPVTTADNVTLDFYNAWVDFGMTFVTTDCDCIDGKSVYYHDADTLTSGDVTTWQYLGTVSGTEISFDAEDLGAGTFIIAVAGINGSVYVNNTVCAPGGIRLTIEEE